MRNYDLTPGVFADPTVDFAFKRIFGTDRFKEATIGLISDITGKKVKHLEFRNGELVPEFQEGKKCIVDVLCQDENGNWFTVEMQRARQANFLKRMVFYSSKVISSFEMGRGMYDYDIKENYVISFIKFPIKGIVDPDMLAHPYVHHFITTNADSERKVKFPGSPEYYIFDLNAFDKKEDEVDNNLDYWLYLLSESKDLEEMPEFAEGNKALETFFEASKVMAFTPEEYKKYTDDMMNEWDYANSIQFAKDEGRAEGKVEDARAFKAKGIPVEVIAECTGLSVEEVQAL